MQQRISLWSQPNFMKLWVGQTVSQFGSQLNIVAFPLIAVTLLHANAAQMGILGALGTLPFLLIGLFAGVYVDSVRRRPLLAMADCLRFVLVAAVPVLYFMHHLIIVDLYIVEFTVGCATVLFDLAYQSYLPSLISRDSLTDGNSKLELSRSTSQIAGPNLGALLVQVLSAPVCLVIDAASYLFSVVAILLIPNTETPPPPQANRKMWSQIREGLAWVFQNRILWSIAACTATSNFFGSLSNTVYVLYLVHGLKLTGAWLGVIYGIGSVGGLLGAIVATRLTKRLGLGRTIILAILFGTLSHLLVPLAPPAAAVAISVLIFSQTIGWGCVTIYNINQVSLRQSITPNHLLGRLNASVRFIIWGSIPLGSLVGGWFGSRVGIYPTLWIGGIGAVFSVVWILLSPVRSLQAQPTIEPVIPFEDTSAGHTPLMADEPAVQS